MLNFFGENEKLGTMMCALGVFLGTIGVFLLFDRALLSLGNLSFLVGVTLMIGPIRAFKFFFKPTKWRASIFYFGGMIVVLWGWCAVGTLFEFWGIWLLFRALLPNVVASIKLTPFGFIFRLPGLKQAGDWIYDQRRLPV